MGSNSTVIRAKAPTRVDLAGSTLDIWPMHQFLDFKTTVNMGITLYAQTEIMDSNDDLFHITSQDLDKSINGSYEQIISQTELPIFREFLRALWQPNLPKLIINTSAMSPAGAGLGGSSALAITITASLLKRRELLGLESFPDDHLLVQTTQDIEARLIRIPTGCQDYWGAVRGKINLINFPPGRAVVTTVDNDRTCSWNEDLVVCFSGKSRASADNNWQIYKQFIEHAPLQQRFNEIGQSASECATAIKAKDWTNAMEFSKREWQQRKALWPIFETHETKRLEAAALQAGAYAARVCGAGGGGVMAIFAPAQQREEVCKALVQNGGFILDAKIANHGLEIECFEAD